VRHYFTPNSRLLPIKKFQCGYENDQTSNAYIKTLHMTTLKVHITMSSYNVSIRKVYKCTSEGKTLATKRKIIACFSNSGKNRLDHKIFIDE
jgi:hypothetical protein